MSLPNNLASTNEEKKELILKVEGLESEEMRWLNIH